MTAIIPLTLLSTQSRRDAQLYLRTCVLGHFGLLPLLYRPVELALKTFSYVAFLAAIVWALKSNVVSDSGSSQGKSSLTNIWDRAGLLMLSVVFSFMEIIHRMFLSANERLEFLPLLMTSISCAVGLIICWIVSFALLYGIAQVRCTTTRKSRHKLQLLRSRDGNM